MHVIAHVAVGLDGGTRITPDGRFEALADELGADVVLTGADTILPLTSRLWDMPLPGPDPAGPLLAIVDSRDRVETYDALARTGRYRDAIALRGSPRVDLRGALQQLEHEHQARTVRVASGGTLLGALLEDRLVDELSLLVHPVLAPGPRWWGRAEVQRAFVPTHAERLDDELVWLRHRRP